MDPLTQGVVGAAAAQSAQRGRTLAVAAAVGWIAGMAPDLDVLIRSSTDPLLFLEYHRQFTHALVFIPFGALVCTLVVYRFVRRWITFRLTYLSSLVGYATHGVLDACTSYGTLLLWPFSDARIAWNNISVVDPLVTLPLLALVITAALTQRPLYARLAVAWAVAYLMLGVVQNRRAMDYARDLARARGHEPEELVAKPSFANLLVWRVIYADEDDYYVDAVRLGFTPTHTGGARVEKLDLAGRFPWLAEASQQARDVERFRWFSAGYLAVDPDDPLSIVDIRYSLVPSEVKSLWGIRLDPGASGTQHVTFFTDRSDSRSAARRLLQLIRGE